ncbi:unnamed protein product [Rotaria magnacalcarata]|uniref:Zinc finger MYND domain-containing protein 10 n=1 Tax=Rotaria magnacalcarata TaxID=392030 RepID=A0A819MS26_9BILA|nr:unnamed protein product [Rotaria magnacalcarata]CAF3983027.1 unnamed protein product [Rotaria magnacalcarata]
MTDDQNVLFSTEVDAFVEALESFEVEDIGKSRWHTQHEYIEKLNMQAILDANRNTHEYVREVIVNNDKLPVLISQLITTEIWREKIFRELIAIRFEPRVTFSIYIIFYHEACIVNLLETLMYHEDVSTSCDDQILDLVDYSYRLLTEVIRKLKQEEQRTRQKKSNQIDNTSNEISESLKELLSQEETLRFDMAMKILSIIRYICDCLQKLPMSVTSRLLDNFDFILLLVDFIEMKPWEKTINDGTYMRHIEGKWQKISMEDRYIVPKIEGQVWLALYQLLLSPHCLQKYEYTEYNKNRITKLRAHLNEVILDQMPHLIQLQRFLEQLSFMEPPTAKKQLVLEQVAELYDRIVRKYKNQWRTLAETQAKTVLNPSDSEARQQAARWANTMNFDILETVINEAPKCAICGEQATKRCSRCQREWYCRRECQVKHWPKHKNMCDMIIEVAKSETSNNSQ